MAAQGPPQDPPGDGSQHPGQGYPPPQQGGYPPPQQGGYPPPQQGGYPPPQQGYPPQPGGYPPQGYPPPQPGYGGGPPPGYPPRYDQTPLASVGARIGAALIDLIILTVIASVIAAASGGLDTTNGFEISLTGIPFLANFLLDVAYFTLLEGTAGASVGKLAVGSRVVKEDYTLAGFGPALVRNLVRIVDYFFCFLIGLIMIMSTQKRQRLGDMAANTLVVRKEFVRL